MSLTKMQEQVLSIMKKHHPEYRDWYEGNILDLQEAKDILFIIDSLLAQVDHSDKSCSLQNEELKKENERLREALEEKRSQKP